MIKTISTPKLILFTVVSLGYYPLFWLARRRNEMVAQYKLSIPAWQWIVLPPILMVPFSFIVTYVLILSLGTSLAILISLGIVFMPVFAYLGLSIWWVQKFGAAVEKISNGRLSAMWILIYWLFIGFYFIFVVQPFLNSAPANLTTKKQEKPSRRFVKTSIIVLSVVSVLLAALFAGTLIFSIGSSLGSTQRVGDSGDTKRLSDLGIRADALNRRYESCVKELEKTYPDITEAQQDRYVEDYTACEDIRLEQNKAADEYNKLNTKMTFDSIFH